MDGINCFFARLRSAWESLGIREVNSGKQMSREESARSLNDGDEYILAEARVCRSQLNSVLSGKYLLISEPDARQFDVSTSSHFGAFK